MTDRQKVNVQMTEVNWLEREYSACLEVAAKMFELLIASAKISLVFNGSLFAAAAVIIERSGIASLGGLDGSVNLYLTVCALGISILAVVFNIGALVAVRNYDVVLRAIAKRFSEIELEVFGPDVVVDSASGEAQSTHIGRILHINQSQPQKRRAADWSYWFYVVLIVLWGSIGLTVNILPFLRL